MGVTNPHLGPWLEAAAIIGGMLCALTLVLCLLASFLNPGFVDTADRFFADIQAGRLERAYARTAPETRRDLSLHVFTDFLNRTGLASFDSAKWEEYGVLKDGSAELRGVALVRTSESHVSRSLPIRLVFVIDHGHWTIRSIE